MKLWPVFVLGDSRTGTTSIHNYFQAHGLRSIHYFVDKIGISSPIHLDHEANEKKFMDFLSLENFDAYSDYPVRSFYRELHKKYPMAAYILTVRSSTDRWLSSMKNFFGSFAIDFDEDELKEGYEAGNNDIRVIFGGSDRHFLEICIDDDSEKNSRRIDEFLGLEHRFQLSKDNTSTALDNNILSMRHRFYSNQNRETLVALERIASPGKSIISEYGWNFLINDTNEFLSYQFGNKCWTDEERDSAALVIKSRASFLNKQNINYTKFVIPEKSVVYSEYLPRVLAGLEMASKRPAEILRDDNPIAVHYLGNYMADAKSYGTLYFRGDSHPNWLGAWFIYRYIASYLATLDLLGAMKLIVLKDLIPTISAYEGDLWTQLNDDLKEEFLLRWDFTVAANGYDLTVELKLPDDRREAYLVDTPSVYEEWFKERKTYIYERRDGIGLRVVVFRDSTLDFCHDLIAQHFARTVFVWHQGQVYQEIIELEKPDVVLHVMAERFVTRYPKSQPFGNLG
jgi:hypothetical protein